MRCTFSQRWQRRAHRTMRKVSRPEIDSKIEADKNKKDAHTTL
jgi:hypothetical protein